MKIGILYGIENTFPLALIERINASGEGISAGSIRIGASRIAEPSGYAVIIDRASHEVPFYGAYVKNAVLCGARVINNPFWCAAYDNFFNCALATRLGVATPRTVVLPHKQHPPGTSELSLRNLAYPLHWDEIFGHVHFPAFLKPISGTGWKNVYRVESPDEFFRVYDDSGDLCMLLQEVIPYDEYYRCYVVGCRDVHIMRYDPAQAHINRYVKNGAPVPDAIGEQIRHACLQLCGALGYDINSVEFAVHEGVPYAIDFLNPVPEADLQTIGPENFEWLVDAVARLAIDQARLGPLHSSELRWMRFLNSDAGAAKT